MGKARKRERKLHTNHHDNAPSGKKRIVRRNHSQALPKKGGGRVPPVAGVARTKQKHRVPFVNEDHVLCVGEGDFSFAKSLLLRHKVKHITATCYDSEETLHQKYPHAQQNLHSLLPGDPVSSPSSPPEKEGSEWQGLSQSPSILSSPSPEDSISDSPPSIPISSRSMNDKVRILYGINAMKLSTTHSKLLRPYAPFTKIVFNFPHVGGLSTDVNRQVRANQELLVGFFKAAIPMLATAARPVRRDGNERSNAGHDRAHNDVHIDDDNDIDHIQDSDDDDVETPTPTPTSSQILVTLFEGAPYDLWNIRDLARHSGLRVVESFRFPWSAYPGYAHARTVGEITRGKDRSDEGKRRGKWRGEEREARCFVLEVREEEQKQEVAVGTGANMGALGERKGQQGRGRGRRRI